MIEADLLKYSKATLARYLVESGYFIFRQPEMKRDLDRISRDFELGTIQKELELNAKKKGILLAKGDPKSMSQYYALTARDNKLMSREDKLFAHLLT